MLDEPGEPVGLGVGPVGRPRRAAGFDHAPVEGQESARARRGSFGVLFDVGEVGPSAENPVAEGPEDAVRRDEAVVMVLRRLAPGEADGQPARGRLCGRVRFRRRGEEVGVGIQERLASRDRLGPARLPVDRQDVRRTVGARLGVEQGLNVGLEGRIRHARDRRFVVPDDQASPGLVPAEVDLDVVDPERNRRLQPGVRRPRIAVVRRDRQGGFGGEGEGHRERGEPRERHGAGLGTGGWARGIGRAGASHEGAGPSRGEGQPPLIPGPPDATMPIVP